MSSSLQFFLLYLISIVLFFVLNFFLIPLLLFSSRIVAFSYLYLHVVLFHNIKYITIIIIIIITISTNSRSLSSIWSNCLLRSPAISRIVCLQFIFHGECSESPFCIFYSRVVHAVNMSYKILRVITNILRYSCDASSLLLFHVSGGRERCNLQVFAEILSLQVWYSVLPEFRCIPNYHKTG